jgi:hypothetical protein
MKQQGVDKRRALRNERRQVEALESSRRLSSPTGSSTSRSESVASTSHTGVATRGGGLRNSTASTSKPSYRYIKKKDRDDAEEDDDDRQRYQSKRSKPNKNKTTVAKARAKELGHRIKLAEQEEEARLAEAEKIRVRNNAKADRMAKEELERDENIWAPAPDHVSLLLQRLLPILMC